MMSSPIQTSVARVSVTPLPSTQIQDPTCIMQRIPTKYIKFQVRFVYFTNHTLEVIPLKKVTVIEV